jgi:hypothetical protein
LWELFGLEAADELKVEVVVVLRNKGEGVGVTDWLFEEDRSLIRCG